MTVNRAGARIGDSLAAKWGMKGAPPMVVIGGTAHSSGTRPDASFDLLTFSEENRAFQVTNLWTGERIYGGRGKSAAAVGDFNWDGTPDFLIGDYMADPIGIVWYFKGTGDGAEPGRQLRSKPGDVRLFGFVLADVGDVNGDGYPDAVVGAPDTTAPLRRYEGAAFLYLGSPEGLQTNAVWRHVGGRVDRRFGFSVTPAGDVNHDGLADVLIGAPFAENGTNRNAGSACLFLGAPDGLRAKPSWIWKGPQAQGLAARSLAGLGDVNGDGYPDIAVGVPGQATRAVEVEFVAIFHGNSNGFPAEPSAVLKSDRPRCIFGHTLAAVGDLNRDGFNDLVIGAPEYSKMYPMDGRVSVHLGSTNGLSSEPVWTIEGGQVGAHCGDSICAVGDINGDGCNDFAVGTPGYTGFGIHQGRVDVFFGSTSTYVRVAPFVAPANNWEEQTGSGIRSHRATVIMAFIVVLGASLSAGIIVRLARRARRESERERVRIARDLHDDLGSRLAAVQLLMRPQANIAPGTPQAEEQRQKVESAAREAIEAMEAIVWSVKPANDTVENLVRFITQYAVPFCAPAGIQCTYDIPDILPHRVLDPDRRKNLFLTIKEALANVVKHAGATEVSIRVELTGDELHIVVADNGRGLADRVISDESDGLRNMRERMMELGGTFRVDSNVPRGTQVKICAPLSGRRRRWPGWLSLRNRWKL